MLRVALLGTIIVGGPAGVAQAEDEDTSSSVYLVFDPETGEFVTSAHPDAALPTQTGLEDSGLPDEDAGGTSSQLADNSASGDGVSVAALAGVALLIVLAGAAFVVLRRGRQPPGQTEV